MKCLLLGAVTKRGVCTTLGLLGVERDVDADFGAVRGVLTESKFFLNGFAGVRTRVFMFARSQAFSSKCSDNIELRSSSRSSKCSWNLP